MNNCFDLPVVLNIYSVIETRDALISWCQAQSPKDAGPLEVSAHKVVAIDGAGLQLLAALANMERSWSLVDASIAFATACQTLGFGHWLKNSTIQPSVAKV